MNKLFSYGKRIQLVLFTLAICGSMNVATAQQEPPPFVKETVRAVENMLIGESDAMIEPFVTKYMTAVKTTDKTSLLNRLLNIRNEVKGLQDEISVEPAVNGFRLTLAAYSVERTIYVQLDEQNKQVTDIQLEKQAEPLILSNENIKATFDKLEAEGFAGLLYIKKNGKLLLQHPFGMANEQLKTKNTVNTIFGIGSRPIDFTIAAIHLLDQQGKLKLSDPISKYFEQVPADKQIITIQYLLTGQSGLPDFFHTAEDWDPDLQWIDRETAVNRMMKQTLLFAPGTSREHSHGAFGLLAALIDKISGMSYYEFLRTNFLDPAGMKRTGEYGETRGLAITEFAAGGGPNFVGLPNIPPNWFKKSWLVKGSGGMFSTLTDLQQFYTYVRSGKVLDAEHSVVFRKNVMNLDGSDRGFELFSAANTKGDDMYLFLNKISNRSRFRQVLRALEKFAQQ